MNYSFLREEILKLFKKIMEDPEVATIKSRSRHPRDIRFYISCYSPAYKTSIDMEYLDLIPGPPGGDVVFVKIRTQSSITGGPFFEDNVSFSFSEIKDFVMYLRQFNINSITDRVKSIQIL